MEPLSRATPEPKRVAKPADTIIEQMELNQDSISSDDTTTVKVQETIEQMETPAELRQDGNSEQVTVSICPDNREANKTPAEDITITSMTSEVYSSAEQYNEDISQAEEGTVYLQNLKREQPFIPEGEEETIPYYNENCEEEDAGQHDMDYSSENSEENARQEHGKPIDDTVKKNDPLVESDPTCSCGECSTAEETNAETEEMEGVTKKLRNSNIDLSDRVRTLQGQIKELEKFFQKDTPQRPSSMSTELHEDMDHMDTEEDDLKGVEETLDHSGDERNKEEENLENSEDYCIQETGTNDNIDEGPRDSMDDHEAEYQIGGNEAERRKLLTEGFRILKIMYRKYKRCNPGETPTWLKDELDDLKDEIKGKYSLILSKTHGGIKIIRGPG